MNLKSTMWSSLKFISNLYFSISLFLCLAFISVIGTIIEQEQSLDYYQLHYPINQPVMFFITWKKILFLGLNHLYSTYWFLLLLLFFFLSLLICTFSTQLPILKYSRYWKFLYSQESLVKRSVFSSFQSVSFTNLIYLLSINNYFVFHKGKGIYAYKGLIGRIAPIFVHLSIIITFVGFILRMTNGFVVQEIVPNSELFHLQNMVASGNFSSVPCDIVGKVDDFFITFNEDKSIKQFFSRVSLLDNSGQVISSKYIWVNSPVKFKGLTIYQTDWQINALRIRIGSDKFIVKKLQKINIDNSIFGTVWACSLVLDQNHSISILIPDLKNSLLVYDNKGTFLGSSNYDSCIMFYGVPVVFKDLIVSTGLQIKTDPGIFMSYLGFFILMCSIVLSYISYSQVWANECLYRISIGGSTNRSILIFENEMANINKAMKTLLLL